MKRELLEHKTVFSIPNGEIALYETNIPGLDIDFCFKDPAVSMMLHGEKKVMWQGEELNFGTQKIFVPEKNKALKVDIANASFQDPLKCVILTIEPQFLTNFFQEVSDVENEEWKNLFRNEKELLSYFVSEETLLLDSFGNLLRNRAHLKDTVKTLDFVFNLKLKEIAYLLLQTKARNLLLNFNGIDRNNPLYEVVDYINENFREKLRTVDLASRGRMSEAALFQKFKKSFGCTPNHYIVQKRLDFAKNLIQRSSTDLSISEVCYASGFNSLEYFSRKFKEIVGLTPSQFKAQG